MQKKHITAMKEVLIHECGAEYDEQIAQKGLNFEAFKNLYLILIQKKKLHINWTVLRHFGYDNDLQLKESVTYDGTLSKELVEDSRAELSSEAVLFLTKLFNCYKNTLTNSLDDQAFDSIFFPNEGGVPWDFKSETVGQTGVNLQNWVGLWQKQFQEDALEGFKLLVRLGFSDSLKNAVVLRK